MSNDAKTIETLNEIFEQQSKAFLKDQNPSLDERRARLGKIAVMMMSHRQEIRDALNADFGNHPFGASDLIETLGPAARAQHVMQNLDKWTADDIRETDPNVYGDAKAFIRYQPKGVIGNIVPWNFPFDLSVGPLCEMLGAGNRVIIKPSELSPACGKLLEKMISATFPRDLVAVVNGDLELSKAFSKMPWNHLLYTGSPAVAKQIMREAAANLVPVTLELGGKCPAIMTPGSVTKANVDTIINIKMVKNGQMCISVDTVHVARADLSKFVELAQQTMKDQFSSYSKSDDCTGIISSKHMERIQDMVKEASSSGAKVVTLESDGSDGKSNRQIPLTVVIEAPKSTRVASEEIFGPIFNLQSYDEVEDAIAHINAQPRPLGLYVFGEDEALIQRVLDNTNSGGAAVNCAAAQGALPSLGFGGSGNSGFGRHHGYEGFLEFSNPRGVFVRGKQGDYLAAFGPPYALAQGLADHQFARAAQAAQSPPVEKNTPVMAV